MLEKLFPDVAIGSETDVCVSANKKDVSHSVFIHNIPATGMFISYVLFSSFYKGGTERQIKQ